jgi:hypothetical protein
LSGSRDWKYHSLRLVQAKIWQGPIKTKKLVVVAHARSPSYKGGVGKRITVQDGPSKKRELLSKNKPKKV